MKELGLYPPEAEHADVEATPANELSVAKEVAKETERPTLRPLELLAAEAQDAFPHDTAQASAFRAYLLRGAHSPETRAIGNIVHENLRARGWTFVDIYGGTSVSVHPNERTHFMLTNKLNGCIATLIASERADGTRDVAMTHFPDLAQEKNFAVLKQIIGEEMSRAPKKKVVLLVTKKHAGAVAAYERELRQLLGPDVAIEVTTYTPDRANEATGMMVVEVPPTGKGSPRYQTWEKGGDLVTIGKDEIG